jgi:catechol 2,3-dioxygenase-like lactoylglutathione lyase family enzyme
MQEILAIVPQLPSVDFEATKTFYTQNLGFTLENEYPDLLIFTINGQELHFWKCGEKHIAENSSVYIRVQDIDALFDRYKAWVHPHAGLADKPWGMREFYIQDHSGNLLKFGSPLG